MIHHLAIHLFGALRKAGLATCGAITLLVGALLFLPPCAQAQSTASLTGTVRDVSGAIVPGARVVLTNQADGSTRATVSNGSAFFSFNAVQPGVYTVRITEKGFEAWEATGVELHPSDERTIDAVRLQVGRVEEQVTVTSDQAGVSLSSPEKSALITSDDIARLSTVGRDVTELIRTLPGFAVSTGGNLNNNSTNNNAQTMGFGSSSVSSFSANGATPQTGATTVVSDGASVMDPGDMGASISNVNMEMVAEVKVQTSNFGADSAKGPVVVNAVSKSGTSAFHGSAYLYARNYALNSNDWLSNYSGITRPESTYYYPGGNISGPVIIPGTSFNHAKKLTFFSGFEYYKQSNLASSLLSFVPTARMLSGDLSAASIASALNISTAQLATDCPNFYTNVNLNSGGFCTVPQGVTPQGDTIVNGQIPMADIDPNTAAYVKFYPAPNRTPHAAGGLDSDGYNYATNLLSTHNGFQYHARVDQNFSDNTKLYLTYNLEKINDEQPIDNTYYAGSDIIAYPTPDFSHTAANSLTLNLTHVFGPTVTNELVLAGVYFYEPTQLANRNLITDASTGFTGGRFYNNGASELPGIVDYEEGVPDFAMSYFGNGGVYYRKFSYDAADNLTKQYKSHSIKLGVYAESTANNQVPSNYSQGDNTFNHYNSGCAVYGQAGMNAPLVSQLLNNVGNFLTGCTGFSQSNSSPAADLKFHTLDFYGTDEWKATKRLTLTGGVRFDHLGPWLDSHGNGLAVWTAPAQGTYNPTLDPANPKTWPGIAWHQTDSSIPLSGAPSRPVFISPRVGLAYDLTGSGKSVFRGGWGAYRFHDSYNDSAGALGTTIGSVSYGVPAGISCTYAQIQNSGLQSAGQPIIPIPVRTGFTANPAGQYCGTTATGAPSPFTLYALDRNDDKQPVTYNYNFTVDQQFPHNHMLELSYVGNQSHDIFTAGNLRNQNYIPLGSLFHPDPVTGAIATPVNAVTQDYRPYRNYSAVYVPNHIGYGNYNALQISMNKTKGALIYGVNFTWEKALGVRGDYRSGVVGDPSNLRNNYGYLGFNRDYLLNFNFSYQEGNLYHGERFLRGILNQWEVSGITSLQSGPDVAAISSPNFGIGGGLSYVPAGSNTIIQESINSQTVLGTPDISLQPVVTCNPKGNLSSINAITTVSGVTYPNVGKRFINPGCFALPASGTNGEFELPNVRGPAYFNSDLTVFRNFRVGEKQNLQFRLAAFNFLNHPLYQLAGGQAVALGLSYGDAPCTSPAASPSAGLPPCATTRQQALSQVGLTTSNFGTTPYKAGSRLVEVGAKYTF